MAHPAVSVQSFVYAEDREGGRGLGFKLLAPTNAPWSAEVEALARRLQACSYPETWGPADLFCSVLLEGGLRLVGLARYGLRDHTASQRGGGLELLGAVGPSTLDLETARALVHLMQTRRQETSDPLSLAGTLRTDALPPPPELPPADPRLPLSLTRAGGTLLITGSAPEDPNRSLGLLAAEPDASWQWLPFCGPDFPFETYSQRGPLIAWAPPRTDLALFLSRPRMETPAAPVVSSSLWPRLILAILLTLLGLNLYAWWSLPGRMPPPPEPKVIEVPVVKVLPGKPVETPASPEARERFAQALYRLAAGKGEILKEEKPLLQHYQVLVGKDPELRCDHAQGQALVAALDLLAGYNPERVARLIQEEFEGKRGLDPEVVRLISERVRQRLAEKWVPLNNK